MTVAEKSIARKTMKAREVEIIAPYGQKTKTIQALRDAGCAVSNGVGRWDPERERRYTPCPDQDAIVELAKARVVRIISARSKPYDVMLPYQQARARREYTAQVRNMSREQLGEACVKARGYYTVADKKYRNNVRATDAVEEILRRVGPAGEQAQADEARYFESYDVQLYETRNYAGRDWRGVSRAVIASDHSAAILSFVEAGSYLNKRVTWDNYDPSYNTAVPGGLHHLRIAAYLILKDSSSGNRHVLRIPPRFGRYKSATWQRYVDEFGQGDTDGMIHAAIAWTFGMKPDEYQPDTQS